MIWVIFTQMIYLVHTIDAASLLIKEKIIKGFTFIIRKMVKKCTQAVSGGSTFWKGPNICHLGTEMYTIGTKMNL